MKKRILLILIVLFNLPTFAYAYNSYPNNYNNNSLSRYDIIIDEMDYTMNVNENHSYDIHIRETVTFKNYYHGIYRAIAKSGTFYRQIDGKEIASNYYAVIKNVKVESGQKYNTDTDGDAYIIQIGDPNRTVIGTQTYEYSYTYDPGDDNFDTFDDIYQNIITRYLENPIETLNITVNMPKDFDPDEVSFFDGAYGSTTNTNMEFTINSKTIEAHNTEIIYPGSEVTLSIYLPNGYFQNIFTGKEYLPIFYIGAIIAIIFALIVYLLKGKQKKPLEPVMFYPPDGLDSAQVAYIIKNKVTNESLVSLLIYFADQGWITIENITPQQPKAIYQINKISEIPLDRPNYERTIFNALFSRNDSPLLDELTNKRFMGNAFIQAQEQLTNWFSGKNKLISNDTYFSKFLIFLSILVLGVTFGISASYLIEREFDFFLFIILALVVVIGPTGLCFSSKSHKKNAIVPIILIIIGGLFPSIFTHSLFMTISTLVSQFVLGLLGFLSYRRTELGQKWYGECMGFIHFIKTAELERLKLLVEENPEYYYNILPYAYALDLTDKWAKNFEGIALNPPDWYIDPYFDYTLFRSLYFMNAFNRGIAANVNHINTQAVRGMGSGGFGGRGFGGGGFGGGFGGGGGGGIGGGGW